MTITSGAAFSPSPNVGNSRVAAGAIKSTGSKIQKAISSTDGKKRDASGDAASNKQEGVNEEIAKAEKILEKEFKELSDKERKEVAKNVVAKYGKATKENVKKTVDGIKNAEWGAKGASGETSSSSGNKEIALNSFKNKSQEQGSNGSNDNSGGNSNQGKNREQNVQDPGNGGSSQEPSIGGKYANPELGLNSGSRFENAVREGDIKNKSDAETLANEYGFSTPDSQASDPSSGASPESSSPLGPGGGAQNPLGGAAGPGLTNINFGNQNIGGIQQIGNQQQINGGDQMNINGGQNINEQMNQIDQQQEQIDNAVEDNTRFANENLGEFSDI